MERATAKEQVSVIERERIIDEEMSLSVDKETTVQMTSFHRAHIQHVQSWEG